MSRKVHVVGNWKMNQSLAEITDFFNEVSAQGLPKSESEFWIAPQFIHLPYCLELASSKSLNMKMGAQDCSAENAGAYTGEVSAPALKDLGAHFVLVGHSERRSLHGESHKLLNKKTHTALNAGIKVIFCVGETLEQREAGKVSEVIQDQLKEGLKGIEKHDQVIIAYEPVWAIGTGVTATPAQAQEVHAMIRNYTGENLGFSANDLIILYGGSVKPDNVAELLSCEDIDGGLVGGASLKANSYLALG